MGFHSPALQVWVRLHSHVPDKGAILKYYGPHIGITKTGIMGENQRPGQSQNSSCCDAAKGALRKLTNNQIVGGSRLEPFKCIT